MVSASKALQVATSRLEGSSWSPLASFSRKPLAQTANATSQVVRMTT
jgi:hypothetical protein